MIREQGFYWIQEKNCTQTQNGQVTLCDPQVAFWQIQYNGEGDWWVWGSSEALDDDEVVVLSKRLEPPK